MRVNRADIYEWPTLQACAGLRTCRNRNTAAEIDVQDFVPVFVGKSTIGVKVIIAASLTTTSILPHFWTASDGRLHFVGIADVALDEDRVPAVLRNLRRSLVAVVGIQIDDGHLAAFCSEPKAGRSPDAGSSAGDEAYFVFEALSVFHTYKTPAMK